MVERNSSFSKPPGFDSKLDEIKRKMSQLRSKTNYGNTKNNNYGKAFSTRD